MNARPHLAMVCPDPATCCAAGLRRIMYGRHAFPHWLLALAVLLSGATARTVSGYLPQATGASALSIQDAEIVELLEAAEVLPGDGRRLLHDGCHRREYAPASAAVTRSAGPMHAVPHL